MNIRGEAALVTGASAGLGKATALALARRGARVAMIARGADALDAAVREVRAESGSADVHGLSFDVGDKEAIHRISGAAAALVGSPSVVVHNASTLGPLPMPLLFDLDCEDLERVLAVNLLGPFRLTKALAGPMVLARRGTFVFVSSDAATTAYERWGAYGVSKAAQDHLARSFAAESPHLRFYAFDPGEMDTKMHADALPDADRSALASPRDVAERLVALVVGEAFPSGARVGAGELTPSAARTAEVFA